jgi:LPXTG-site transpeptidase (sortase) family protein
MHNGLTEGISVLIQKKAPDSFIWRVFQKVSVLNQDAEEKLAQQTPHRLRRKVVNSLIYSLGTVLIVLGILLFIWIARPYFSLLLSSLKIAALEKKVKLKQVYGNRIIIPSILVDASILEGADKRNLSRGVCHIVNSPFPGEGGNFIIEGHNLAEFGLWKPQSFFSLLEVLDKGSPIYVFYKDKKYIYKVKEKTQRDVSDPDL